MSEKHLTRKEAISKGFEYFVYPADGYQSLKKLDEYLESEINFDQKPMLCKKEASHPGGINEKEIREFIADHIWDNHCAETGDDTDVVFDILQDLDCSDLVKQIDERLSKINFHWQSDVHLVCNDR